MSIFEQLKAPFHPDQIQFRAGATNNKDNPTRAMALAFIDAREIMDRLDEVVGPQHWQEVTTMTDNGTAVCTLSVRFVDEWIAKTGVCGASEDKGGEGGTATIAFKRAAVRWGIGRYLYGLRNVWVPCEKSGRYVKLLEDPQLPADMLPEGFTYEKTTASRKAATKPATATKKATPAKPETPANGGNGSKKEEAGDLLSRAEAYVVPKGVPMAGVTLGEVAKDTAMGKMIISYLAGIGPDGKGKMFTPKGEDDAKLKSAAIYIARNQGWFEAEEA